jgi:prepilin-type N-terminal cleavage/methylation domain-containing protein
MTDFHATNPPLRARRRAFTLLEMLVVLAVILVLLGLVLGTSTVLIRRSEVRQTENALAVLEAAIGEFEQSRGRPLTYGRRGQPVSSARFDIPELFNVGYPHAILFVLDRLNSHGPSRDMIAKIDGNLLRSITGGCGNINQIPCVSGGYPPQEFWWTEGPRIELIDPWDSRVAVIFPGRPWQQGDDPSLRDIDGTVRTIDEQSYLPCVNRRIRVISMGPDRDYGTEDDIMTYSERPQ